MTQKSRKKITWDEEGTEVLRGRIISNTTFLNEDEGRGKVLKWTSPLNFSSQKSASLGQRQEGTEKWLLDSGEFQGWMSHNRATLLCVGMPGTGGQPSPWKCTLNVR